MKTHHGLFILGAVVLALALFVALAGGDPAVLAYGVVGAGLCVGLGLFFRKNRMRPLFEPRTGDKP